MKKILAVLGLLLGLGVAHADTTTTRFSLVKPTIGTTGWGTKTNNNWDTVDNACVGLSVYNNITSSNTFNSTTTFNGATLLSSTTYVSAPIYFSAMTATRVPFFGALGLFQDDPDFTFNGTTVSVTGVSASTVSVTARLDMNSVKIVNVANGTNAGDAVNFSQLSAVGSGYERPTLVWSSTNAVAAATNTATANQTCISFPDSTSRCVTENVASADKYRLWRATATAEFTSGTEDSGLRSGYVLTDNTWYQLYAVKSLIDANNFVIVADTIPAVASNYSTLNSAYGSNSWVFLGTVRRGDSGTNTTQILSFKQNGSRIAFTNLATGANRAATRGFILATSASTSGLTYTYSSGVSGTAFPANINLVTLAFNGTDNGGSIFCAPASGGNPYFLFGTPNCIIPDTDITSGAFLETGTGSGAADISITGFLDDGIRSGMNFTR